MAAPDPWHISPVLLPFNPVVADADRDPEGTGQAGRDAPLGGFAYSGFSLETADCGCPVS
jgi:hypothetical protein